MDRFKLTFLQKDLSLKTINLDIIIVREGIGNCYFYYSENDDDIRDPYIKVHTKSALSKDLFEEIVIDEFNFLMDFDNVYNFEPGFKFQFKLNIDESKFKRLKNLYQEYPYGMLKINKAILIFTGGYLHIHNSGSKIIYKPHKGWQIKYFKQDSIPWPE